VKITITNQKGGSGKSTLTLLIAETLKTSGTVLLIDCDPQGGISNMLNAKGGGLFNILTGGEFCPVTVRGMDILSADHRLDKIAYTLPPFELRDIIKFNYDYIIFDTPPTVQGISRAAAIAADRIIIPADISKTTIEPTLYTIDELKRSGKTGKVLFPIYSPLIGVSEVGLKLLLSPEPKGDRAKITRAKEYVRLGLEAAGNVGIVPLYKDIKKIANLEIYKELSKEVKETAVKKEAEAKADAEEIVQKTSILKQMMNSGAYTREGIKKELRKIKDPEYRKAENKIEEDMLKSILDKTKYSSRTDFEKREKENAKNAFKLYDKKREESLKINRELKNRMDALEYGEQYVPKKKKASGTFGGGDSFGGSSTFGGSDSFGGGDSFGGSDSFGD